MLSTFNGHRIALLSLNTHTALHPGNWHIFNNGLFLWKSDDLYTYKSSQQIIWSTDEERVAYTSSDTSVGVDHIFSLDLIELSSSEITNNASNNPAFDYADE